MLASLVKITLLSCSVHLPYFSVHFCVHHCIFIFISSN